MISCRFYQFFIGKCCCFWKNIRKTFARLKGKNELDTSKSRKRSIFAVSVLGVREQEKRTFDEELRSISFVCKTVQMRVNQGERGLFDGSLLCVNAQEQTQVQRRVTKYFNRFYNL